MTTHYTHLTIEVRVTLMIMRIQGSSLRAIAHLLGRQPSTLSREVRRQLQPERYDASAAGARARALRHVPRRSKILAPDSELFQVIHSMLAKGWSAQQIAARLKDYWPDNPERHVSHETLYLTIYAYPRGELKRQLIGYLRQGGSKRRTRSTAPARRERYPAEQNIRYRPEEVEGRQVPGHWESDLIMGTNNRSAVATMVERTSRFVILANLDAPTADAALEAMTRELSRMAPALLKTMTHDQGSEMARHAELTARTEMKIYFATRTALNKGAVTTTRTACSGSTCPRAPICRW